MIWVMKMCRIVPKRNIERLEYESGNKEFNQIKLCLELARDCDDDLWQQLVLLYLEDITLMKSEDINKVRNELRRKLKHGI